MNIRDGACHTVSMSLVIIQNSSSTHEPAILSVFETQAIFALEHVLAFPAYNLQFADIPIIIIGMHQFINRLKAHRIISIISKQLEPTWRIIIFIRQYIHFPDPAIRRFCNETIAFLITSQQFLIVDQCLIVYSKLILGSG
ncbi:hypothetical protein D3C78_609320 [compost metagenome]